MVNLASISDLNCLYICPTLQWGTTERNTIRDCSIFKSLGGFPILLCIKDSYLDQKARTLGIERIYLKRKKVNSFFDMGFYFLLKDLVKRHNVNLIHCYLFDMINTLTLGLGPFPDIPLIFTINKQLKERHKGVVKKILMSRVDSIVTVNKTLRNGLEDCLPLKSRKIHVLGAGIHFEERPHQINTSEQKKLLCYIPKHTINLESILTLFNALHIMGDSNFRVTLVTERDWGDFVILPDVMKEAVRLDIQSKIDFKNSTSILDEIFTHDLFIGLDNEEYVSDIEYQSVGHGTPVLLSRNAARSDMLESFPGIGESYHPNDARELKDKCLKILGNLELYHHALEKHHEAIKERNGDFHYRQRMKTLYAGLVEVRRRLIGNR